MAYSGILHRYTSRLVAFEHTPPTSTSPSPPPPNFSDKDLNTLLWIGGLGDGLLTVEYPATLAKHLPPNWRISEVLLSSSYSGWATGSLQRDVNELARCVKYFRASRTGGKIVLMGHSTGCQDILEYLVGEGRDERLRSSGARIDGAVLQAGVSDREALVEELDEGVYREMNDVAKGWVERGKGDDVLPDSEAMKVFGCPMTARRWLSLASPEKDGADDFFSSDLPDDRLVGTFGSIGNTAPVCFLFSGEDQHVPRHVDKEALVQRWTEFVRRGGGVVDDVNGGVVVGARHNLNRDPEEVVMDLVARVVGFLKRVDGGGFEKGGKL